MLEIYKEMKNLIDLENDFSKNTEDTDMKNLFVVRPNESVDVITMGCRDFKCTQCTFRKQTCGAVESHMYDTHGISGLNVCSVTLPPEIHIHFMCILTAIMKLTS